jgi:hypothetical protein
MRKKVNSQVEEYVEDQKLKTFGISAHSITENFPKMSKKAQRDMLFV